MKSAQAVLSLLLEPHAAWSADWIWGLPLIVSTVIVHVLGLGFISQKAIQIHSGIERRRHYPHFTLALVLGSATLLATVLHALETGIWALAYCGLGALSDFPSSMLYSLGAMTTYGHQDISLAAHWRLLGSIEALNGWLLFGLSTAFLFWLIQEVTPSKSD
jgi:hypothetical protein